MADQIEVRMSALADSMTSAALTAWLKRPGDRVTAGEPIAEIETDKTTVEIEAPADGVLTDVRVAAGAGDVAVGTLLAIVEKDARTGGAESSADSPPPPGDGTDRARDASTALGGSGPEHRDRPPERTPVETAPAGAGEAGPAADPAVEIAATPLARRMAALVGLDLSRAIGSGTGGRVMKVDVERLLPSSRRVAAPVAVEPAGAAERPPAPASDIPHTDRPPTAMRRVTAQRMTESKQAAPHFYLEIECAVDRLPALRGAAAATDAASPADGAGAPTVNDIVVRASALALREVPSANSAWTGDAVRVYDRIDLAVAVTTPGGLVTPVIRAADTKSLTEIAAEMRRLAANARAGRLQPADYQNGTCTISNLGMYGVSSLYAILNPPQSCILGVGAVAERPVVRNGAVAVGSTMKVTLSADHRAVDGATGAELLRALKALLEDPQRLYG